MKARSLLRAAGLCVASLVVSAAALAQAWPSKQPVRFVVPYPPGGASDVTARLLSVKLTEALGQAFVVENRPGANGLIALEYVAKAAPDGYTLLMANLGPNAINPAVYRKLPYDAIKDFTPITLTSVVPLVVLVQPTMPVNSMKELIAYAKAHPDKLTYASAGNGSANHLAGEMMKSMASFKMVHVPYKGDAPGLQDTIAGNVSVIFPTVIGGMSQIKSGLLKPIAVTGAKRSSALASVPTVAEGGIPNFEANSWGGVMGPANLPPEIVARLNTEIVKILKQPETAAKLTSMGADIVGSTPEEFASYLKNEVAKWGKVAHENNITLD
ncbi:Bug family tripartite tricarboxylate transporter substrate binding protein [Variovorax sp.]|jgi:tripartite-type tricarboxylate transporter receptor subunit TctC|uniref:Bug family tripartite tricarboxylate transporter substrate binding protein n=1 Tax=Variovorax sp. TaxID=1871043 RepID=UPI001220C50C|nr:tripartite tricarboxylate transporter substrate binding protein [Variovorax sp.]TAJ58283.1 MAG: tripartite tricarboxylate transporter substrate binding protein [Variovorax sp.]